MTTLGNHRATANSTKHLALKLLKAISGGTKNICISPLSIGVCLQLALAGAKGTTAKEMVDTMGIVAASPIALAADYEALANWLTSNDRNFGFQGPGVKLTLELANSIWLDDHVSMRADFATALEHYYQATCATASFSNGEAVRLINEWVASKTHGKIQNIIQNLVPQQMLVLVNCAYFKGTWKQEFSALNTTNRDFFVAPDAPVSVPMMKQQIKTLYYGDNSVQAISLSYIDSRFSMLVVLPALGQSLETLVSDLTIEKLDNWLSQSSEHRGFISLPRFKLEFFDHLNEHLVRMGMREAFSSEADFSNMLTPDAIGRLSQFHIGLVVHKTFIEVDEKGTEAAAATALAMWGGAPPAEPPPFEMTVDRPFLFAVREEGSGTILFCGTVVDPSS